MLPEHGFQSKDLQSNDRLVIHRLARDEVPDEFAQDVRAGLLSRPKSLAPRYFYDDLGSQLFEAICLLPEYYLTRAESEILRNHSDEIVSSVEGPVRLIELGSGSAEKTRYLIEALLAKQQELHYLPIDISDVSLDRSSAVFSTPIRAFASRLTRLITLRPSCAG